jgi:two-component system, response regulator PdtaR
MSVNRRLHAPAPSNRAPSACAAFVGTAPGPATETLRVVVADPDLSALALYQAALTQQGHVVEVARTDSELVEACQMMRPDLVVSDIGLAESDELTMAGVFNDGLAAVILVDDDFDLRRVERVLAEDWVMAWLARPVTESALGAALAVAARQSLQVRVLRAQVVELKQALEDRKLLERAKEAVMKRLSLSEADAYERMRTLAAATNQKLIEVSRKVLAAETAFSELEAGSCAPHLHGSGPVVRGR